MKNIWQKLVNKITSSVNLNEALNKVKASGSSSTSLLDKMISMRKPPIEKYYPIIISAALAYTAADLTNTYIRSYTIPSELSAQTAIGGVKGFDKKRLRSEYNPIAGRNIFNSDGVIPPPISGGGGTSDDIDGPASPSDLPMKLIGTIVHANPMKSVATVEVSRGAQKIIPYLIDDDMEGMATLLKIERQRIVFRNRNNGRLEYIEMDKDLKFQLKVGAPAVSATSPAGISGDGNEFSIDRSTIEKYTANIGEVLQQARAVPNRDPITGEVNGFRILFIKPDSIFTQLGLKPGDLLQEVNGQKVTSIQQAMEMYQGLKSASNISIAIEREGRNQSLNYNVTN